jgi:DNA segregation ATPase FtsK/SpoIIIE, S-DNA-T family
MEGNMQRSPFFQRAPRVKKLVPYKEITIHKPDPMPQKPTFSVEQLLFTIFLALVSVGMYYFIGKRMSSGNNTYMFFMLASSVPMVLSALFPLYIHGKNKKQYKKDLALRETTYKGHLQNHIEELEDLRSQQGKVLHMIDPNPIECVKRVRERQSNLWERSPESEDFLHLRLGIGKVPLSVTIQAPQQQGYEQDPLIEQALQISSEYQSIQKAPVRLPLFKSKIVGIVGDKQERLNVQRLIALQIATHHSPDEVKMVSLFPQSEENQWNWMRWLPHTWDDERQVRFLANDKTQAEQLMEKIFSILNIRKIYKEGDGQKKLNLPIFALFLSAKDFVEEDPIYPLLLKDADTIGACTFLFANRKEELPMQCKQIIEVGQNVGKLIQTFSTGNENVEETDIDFIPDSFSLEDAERMARYMAPVKLKQSASESIPKVLTLFDMFKVKKIEELDIINRWEKHRYPDTFPVPIGVRAGGKEVVLNIHDKIEKKGHGPHGLMAGTTGSGKSEVIQSIIASLAATYHPHEMAFMLIDYKGGGMSNTFEGLPHVIATVTNLVDGNLIERAKVSLKAELVRRQKLFVEAGNIQHIDEYYKSSFKESHPLPHLFIVIDEFAQLKKEQPEFMDELISIAAIGRTLGVHLLLATQKPAGVVDDKIWSNSRFRICLRVQDEADSRDMLKIPNASKITVPGRGYLQVGSDEVLELFQSAYSGADYNPDNEEEMVDCDVYEVKLNGEKKQDKKKKVESSKPKQLQVFNDYLKEQAERAGIRPLQGPWLEPLPTELFLDELYDIENWTNANWEQSKKWLKPVVGKVDDIENQEQFPLELDLEEGHLAIYGQPGTGKTTLLQTVTLSLALTHTPADLQFYFIDFGRMLRDLIKLPHVGGIVQEEEQEKMSRLFRFLMQELMARKDLFSVAGAKTLASYRQSTGHSMPAIVVMIDGYLNFRNTFEEENALLEQLMREGASLGIYFVITANNVGDIFDRVRSNIPSALTFELAEPSDYYMAVGRPTSPPVNLPEGRGLVKGHIPPLMFQGALASKGETEAIRTSSLRALIEKIGHSWNGEPAKTIPELPTEIPLKQLLSTELTDGSSHSIPAGLEVDSLSRFELSLSDGPYFLVGGRVQGGKTTALNSMLLSMASQMAPDELQIYLIDIEPSRGGILSLRNLPHVKGFAMDEESAGRVLTEIREMVDTRKGNSFSLDDLDLDESEVTGSENPAVVLVIDDLDHFNNEILSLSFELKDHMEYILKHGRGKDFYGLFAGEANTLDRLYDDWFKEIKKSKAGFILGTTDSNSIDMLNIRVQHQDRDQELPAGEGFYSTNKFVKVKLALPFTDGVTPRDWTAEIKQRWAETSSILS